METALIIRHIPNACQEELWEKLSDSLKESDSFMVARESTKPLPHVSVISHVTAIDNDTEFTFSAEGWDRDRTTSGTQTFSGNY